MESKKIGLLILSTSNKRDNWSSIKDSYLYNLTLKTFLLTQNKEHKYVFYIGIDPNDRIYDKENQQKEILRFSQAFKNVEFKFIKIMSVTKGHVTIMWNKLFKIAYDENCDYFFQCGDDIYFRTSNWINDCITTLKNNNDIGITGPINNNFRILTQAFVSRKHMEIFGWFFPEEIINWCCDDWYNLVYQPSNFFPLRQHFCSNNGGEPRYIIDNNPAFKRNDLREYMSNVNNLREKTQLLANEHKKLINNYLNK